MMKVQVTLELTVAQLDAAITQALVHGFKRREERKAWRPADRKEAVRFLAVHLVRSACAPVRQYEVALSVADHGGDFEETKLKIDHAASVFMLEAHETGTHIAEIKDVTFEEFDSSNANHAAAYFIVTYRGDEFPDEPATPADIFAKATAVKAK